MPKTGIQPADLFDAPAIGFSQGVAVGSTLYVSGQVSTSDGLAAQVADAWASVVSVVVVAGGSAASIVKLTIFTKDEAAWSHLQPLIKSAMEPPFPAATMVTVVGLARPEFLVEIEAVAHLDV